MAKASGLNVRLYVQGADLSGDANSLGGIGYSQELYEITALDKSAVERMIGLVDGTLSVNGFFDNRTGGIHPTFTSNSGKQPTADQNVLVPLGSAIGDGFYGLVAKQAEYNVDRGDSGAVSVVSSFQSTAGASPQFGTMMTAFSDTFSSASSGTVVDGGASSSGGGVGFLQVFSLASGSVTVKVEESTSSGGSYSAVTTFSTVAAAAAPTAERTEMTGTVQRYLKVTTTGTFSNAVIAVGFARL